MRVEEYNEQGYLVDAHKIIDDAAYVDVVTNGGIVRIWPDGSMLDVDANLYIGRIHND